MRVPAPAHRLPPATAGLLLGLTLAACSGAAATPAPATPAPATLAPATAAPATPAPASEAPATPEPVTPAPASEAAPASGDAVTIAGLKFSPASLTVKAGATVTWANADGVPHTATADDGSFASDTLSAGGTFSHTFDAAGTFAYHCAIHPRMLGTIVVE